jgi:CheY-like chemotaxis protein
MTSFDGLNILMVDDRSENLQALEAILDDSGLNLHRALSGNEALGKLLRHEYAMVLLDVQMPDMNGFEVASAIKGYDRTRDIPIIFLTAISRDIEHVLKGYGVGAADYMVKPINPDLLKSKVKLFTELYVQKCALQAEVVERKKVENKLRQSRERYRRLIESNIFGVFHSDKDGDVLDANEIFLQMIGYAKAKEHSDVLSLSAFMIGENGEKFGIDELRREAIDGIIAARERFLVKGDGVKVCTLFGAACLEDGGWIFSVSELS